MIGGSGGPKLEDVRELNRRGKHWLKMREVYEWSYAAIGRKYGCRPNVVTRGCDRARANRADEKAMYAKRLAWTRDVL